MINQHLIDPVTENLASELNLHGYDHLALAEIVQSQINELILDMTQYPSKYFRTDVLSEVRTKTQTGGAFSRRVA